MSDLTRLQADDLRACHNQLRERYDAFAKRGLKLNLTRGKPSSQQLDLCNELLEPAGVRRNFMAGAVDSRNYGELQGLPELRALLAPVFGVTADRVIIGDNSSLSLMHDAVVFSHAQGNLRQRSSLVERIAHCISVSRRPATTVTSSSARSWASR